TVDFDPGEYHDRYREALQELVEAKVEGREVLQPQPEEEASEPTSLADALRASLAAARTGGGAQEPGDAPAPKRAAASGGSRSRSARAPAGSKDDAQPGGRGKADAGSRRTAKAAADDDEAPARTGTSRTRKTTPKQPAAPRRPRKRAS
ncbi:MAG: hypothetical protein ACRDPO_28540, partial [Streptosporangiaceae bacterium]